MRATETNYEERRELARERLDGKPGERAERQDGS